MNFVTNFSNMESELRLIGQNKNIDSSLKNLMDQVEEIVKVNFCIKLHCFLSISMLQFVCNQFYL